MPLPAGWRPASRAASIAPGALAEFNQPRFPLTDRHGVVAAEPKAAAARQFRQIGHDAGDAGQPPRDALFGRLRDRGQKSAGVGVQGTVEEIEDIGLFDDLPGIHDVHRVAHLGDDPEVMGDHDDRGADPVAQIDHQPHDLGLRRHVQRGRGLVGDQKLRLADQAHGDHRPLPQAARKLMGKGVQPGFRLGDADQLEHLEHAPANLAPSEPLMDAQRLAHLFPDPAHRVERGHRLLKHHRDVAAADAAQPVGVELRQIGAVEVDALGRDLPRRHRHQPHERQGRHGLAGAGFPHQPDDLPAAHLEGNILQHADMAAVAVEFGRELADAEHILGGHRQGSAFHGRVERIAQPVAHEIERQHGDRGSPPPAPRPPSAPGTDSPCRPTPAAPSSRPAAGPRRRGS